MRMRFNNAADVHKYIGGIFREAFDDDEIGPKLRNSGIVLQFRFSEPDTVMVVDTLRATVTDGTAANPTAVMSTSADTGNAYWQGKVNLPLAMAKGTIKIAGNVAGLLKLAPLGKKLYPMYVSTLKRDGRDDLLV
jgi:putative sterol carrier protein